MTKITIHGFPQSTYTRTALMAAHEKGVEAAIVPLAYGKPEHFALHPFGRMPILEHGKTRLIETLAIVSYIDDAFEGPRLIPGEPAGRAETLAAISVAVDYAYRPVVHIEKDGDTIAPDALKAASPVLDWLDKAVCEGGCIIGSSFTAADLFFAPMIGYHQGTARDALIGGRPALRAWFDAMAARPSFAATEAG